MVSNSKKRKHSEEHRDGPLKAHKSPKQQQATLASHSLPHPPPPAVTSSAALHQETPASVQVLFNEFSSNLAALLSYSQEDLQCLGEEKSNFVSALQAMKACDELPWLSSSQTMPTASLQTKWPPELPKIRNPALLQQAFTHKSFFVDEHAIQGVENLHYERLEFLGDAWLQSLASQILYDRFPTVLEGSLSMFRQGLVSNKTLCGYARAYNIPKKLFDVQKKLREGKAKLMPLHDWNQKILADCMESYVAAIMLDAPNIDAGATVVRTWLARLFEPKLQEYEAELSEVVPLDKLAKQRLCVIVGGNQANLEYKWISGRGGKQSGYWMAVYLTGWGFKNKLLGRGWATNKPKAQARAAMDALADADQVAAIAAARANMLDRKLGDLETTKSQEVLAFNDKNGNMPWKHRNTTETEYNDCNKEDTSGAAGKITVQRWSDRTNHDKASDGSRDAFLLKIVDSATM